MSDASSQAIDGNRRAAGQREVAPGRALSDRQHKVLALIEGNTFVDVGCQTGTFVREVLRRFPRTNAIGVDVCEDNIRLARQAAPHLADQFRAMSAYRLDLPDGSTDCITFQEVLEHLEGAALAVKEANRVLRLGGALIVSVPNPYYARRVAGFIASELANVLRRRRGRPPQLAAEILSEHAAWDRHVHGWTLPTLLTLLQVNGFAYVEHAFENPPYNRVRRIMLRVLPFLGPTQILKVRKVAAAPSQLT